MQRAALQNLRNVAPSHLRTRVRVAKNLRYRSAVGFQQHVTLGLEIGGAHSARRAASLNSVRFVQVDDAGGDASTGARALRIGNRVDDHVHLLRVSSFMSK